MTGSAPRTDGSRVPCTEVHEGVRSIERSGNPVRDLVVIGGSAGGFRSLRTLLSALPSDCQAAVFVVLHVSRELPSQAALLLQKHCSLPVRTAEDRQLIQGGTVTLAPYDRHLLLASRHVHLRRGLRENGFRPAIDPLFRSAVVHHGGRAIGVVLSGMLDDGARGAFAMSRVRAPILIEHPDHAEFSPMPQAAADRVAEARCLPVDELGEALVRTIGTAGRGRVAVPEEVRLELIVSMLERARADVPTTPGELASLDCPDCDAVLRETERGGLMRYRREDRHGDTTAAHDEHHALAVALTLFRVLARHRRRVQMLRGMAVGTVDERRRAWLEQRADDYDEDATFIASLLPPYDAAAAYRRLEDRPLDF